MYFSEEKWPKLKKLGRKQFILRYGVLGWGVPVAIGFALSTSYGQGWSELLITLIIALILFPLGGILFGRFLWFWLERKNAPPAAGK
ncbi:MAG TPA: hypothetical protein VH107_18080 [Lacipirellulaceae bacterium]|nr:hypothetical protein [Lacipirellulaceae bacterium]